jgi:hypothetical protein
MLGALGPAVRGVALPRQTVAFGFGLSTMIGSLLAGAVLAAVGALLAAAGLGFLGVGALAVASIVALAQIAGARPLQSRWQVPEPWRRQLDLDVLAVFYGFILGLGVFTAVVVSAFWVFVAATLIVPLPVALAGWAGYGLARAGGFVIAAASRPNLQAPTRKDDRRIALTATALALLVVATQVLI